jgi:hypothetical protein
VRSWARVHPTAPPWKRIGALFFLQIPTGVAASDAGLESLRHHLKHPVANLMPVCIVDLLEFVQVDEQHGERTGMSLCLRKSIAEVVMEQLSAAACLTFSSTRSL